MHRWMTAATSAFLILGIASAGPAAATPSTAGTGQSDDTMEATVTPSINLLARWFTVANNSLPSVEPVAALLSVSPPASRPEDVDNSEIHFPPRADEFEGWLGHDWLP